MKYPHLHIRCIPQRYLVSIQCCILLAVSYMMRFSLSMAITEMTKIHGTENDTAECPFAEGEEKKEREKKMEFEWTSEEQFRIHSGLFWGYITTQVLGGVLSDLFNHKSVLLTGYGITILATAVTPLVTRAFDWIGLFIARIVIGMAQGVFYNSLHAVTAHWAPLKERGFLGTIIFSGVQFGNSLNFLITGLIISYFDWSVVYYSYAIFALIWFFIFFFTTYTYPSQFPGLKKKEQELFEEYQTYVDSLKKNKKVPIRQILKSVRLWAIVLAMFGQDWLLYAVITSMPTYMKSVLHMEVEKNAVINGAVYISLWIIGMITAALADYINKRKWISLTWIRRILYLFGSAVPAAGCIGMTYAECNSILVTIFYILGMSTLGFFYPSVKVNPMDLSPNFAGTIGSIGQMGGCTAGVIVPYVIGAVIPNSKIAEWRIAFFINASVMLFGGIAFFSLASAEIQPFNEYKYNKDEN